MFEENSIVICHVGLGAKSALFCEHTQSKPYLTLLCTQCEIANKPLVYIKASFKNNKLLCSWKKA